MTRAKQENPNITPRAIYARIESVKQEYRNTISIRMAANVLASRMGMDVYGILKDGEELKELRSLIGLTSAKPFVVPVKEKRIEKEQKIFIQKKIADAFGLPTNLGQEANRMAEVYPDLYVFENLMRYVTMKLLKKKYGEDWWTEPEVVPSPMSRKVQERKEKEGRNRWHSERGSHPIFYTDFGDLSSIISNNWDEFKAVFPSLRWIQTRLEETELSRNIIAHDNPLPKKECERLKMFLDDLRKQLDIYPEKKP